MGYRVNYSAADSYFVGQAVANMAGVISAGHAQADHQHEYLNQEASRAEQDIAVAGIALYDPLLLPFAT